MCGANVGQAQPCTQGQGDIHADPQLTFPPLLWGKRCFPKWVQMVEKGGTERKSTSSTAQSNTQDWQKTAPSVLLHLDNKMSVSIRNVNIAQVVYLHPQPPPLQTWCPTPHSPHRIPVVCWQSGASSTGKAKQGREGTKATGGKAAGIKGLPGAAGEDGAYGDKGKGPVVPGKHPPPRRAGRAPWRELLTFAAEPCPVETHCPNLPPIQGQAHRASFILSQWQMIARK